LYYLADELKEYDPAYFKGCVSSRKIIDKINIQTNQYIFACKTQKGWEIKNKDYKKAKLLMRKKYVDENIPKMIPGIDKNEANKMYDVEVEPDILELNDEEKFKDDDGNVIDVEVRGERNYDRCYFKVDDISKGFNIKNIQITIKQEHTQYKEDMHYKYFNNKKQNIVHNSHNKYSTYTKKMFLTYKGMVRLLYCSRSKNVEKFQDWATKILFTHHMGTCEQKDVLSSSLLGISSSTIKEVFRTCSNKTPVVYLFSIGSAKKLLKDDTHGKDILLCKFGCTYDISRRTGEHENNFKKEYGDKMEFSSLLYSIIDPKYIFDAEGSVKDYFKSDKLNKDDKSETILIDKKNISKIRQYYKMVQNQYIGRYKEMNDQISRLEKELEKEKHEKELEREKHEKENMEHKFILEREKHEKELEREKHEKENVEHKFLLEKEKHEKEILKMRLEIMELKCSNK
jgi:hypothetical protein